MENVLTELFESIGRERDKLYGVVVGTVINQLDPMGLGRVQVQIPSIDSEDLSPWARVATPMAGSSHGHYFIPDIDTEVLVAFEHGDINAPYILGSLWNAQAMPPVVSPLLQTRVIKTLAGNTIEFMEVPPTITIKTPTGQTLRMLPTGIQITTGTSVINMSADGITLTGGDVKIVGTTSVSITAPEVSINGATSASVKSGGECSVTAPLVKIN
jgi:phage baseplate assembly protein gpV